jgi:hypothetical protein
MKPPGKRDSRVPRTPTVIYTFNVFGHPAVKSPVCDLQVGQPMNLDTPHAAYAIAKTAEEKDFILLGIEVPAQIGTSGEEYNEHLTVFIFNDKKIIQKIEFKKEDVAFNSIIEIPCGDTCHKVAAYEEIGASVVFHKTGTYRMKSTHVKTEDEFNLTFGKHTGVTKCYSNLFDFIYCFVMQSYV